MLSRLGRFWRRASASQGVAGAAPVITVVPPPSLAVQSVANDAAADGVTSSPTPEQPIPLAPIPGAPRVKVGVLVPTRGSRSLLSAMPTPRVPKRAILAVGIAAGLAAPTVGRQLAGRVVTAALGSGRPTPSGATWETAAVEIIRVTYASPRVGQAAASVGRLLEQFRR